MSNTSWFPSPDASISAPAGAVGSTPAMGSIIVVVMQVSGVARLGFGSCLPAFGPGAWFEPGLDEGLPALVLECGMLCPRGWS